MPALTASHPSRAEQVTSKAQEHHPGVPIANYGVAACQWYDAATPTTPVHVARPREARAIDVARHADLNGDNRSSSSGLECVGAAKRRHALPLFFRTAGPASLPTPAQNHSGDAIDVTVYSICAPVHVRL